MLRIGVSEARGRLAELVDKTRDEAVLLERRGVPVAVLLSAARYEALLTAFDEVNDSAALDVALADGKSTIPWDEVKADLGW